MQDYELVELEIEEFEKNKPNLGSGGYPAIGKPGRIPAVNFGGYNRGFPLPKSVHTHYVAGYECPEAFLFGVCRIGQGGT